MIKYASLFSGIGGFELGIQRASEVTGVPAKCVFASEIDKYAQQTYIKNLGEDCLHGDITKIEAESIPDIDLLVGGFPCQAFSIAGKRKGFQDTRGTMFFEIARICKEKRPKTLLLENVKGLLNHNGGRTFGTILAVLDELGYDAEWQVLNSKDFGVPQNRERVFVVGHFRGSSSRQVFPIGIQTGRTNERAIKAPVVRCLTAGGHSGGMHSSMTLITHSIYPRSSKTGEGGVRVAGKIRRLTPIECERLQSYPDNYTAGVSDTQRFKQLGNTVTVNVVQAIAERILN